MKYSNFFPTKWIVILLIVMNLSFSFTNCAQQEKNKLFVFCNDALYSLSINEQMQVEKTKITDPVIEIDKGIKTKYFRLGLGAPFFFSPDRLSCDQKKVIIFCSEQRLPEPYRSLEIPSETFIIMLNIDGSEKRLLKGEKDDDFFGGVRFAKKEKKYYYVIMNYVIMRKKLEGENQAIKYETQLWRANYDGSGKENLIKDEGFFSVPAWYPYWEFESFIELLDGENILFFFSKDNLDPNNLPDPDLWIMNIKSREKRNLTEEMKKYLDDKETCIFETLLSYDDKKIIMFVGYTEKFGIWSMNIDGSGKKNLTENLEDKELLHPFFLVSPDNKILFTKTPNYEDIGEDEYLESSNLDIWIMNLDGTNIKKLTEKELKFKFPLPEPEERFNIRVLGMPPGFVKFSPDGKRIVFKGKDKNGYSLWIMNSDGSGKKDLGEKIREKFSKELSNEDKEYLPWLFRECWFPTFSPDGENIFFLLPDSVPLEEENFENWRYSLWAVNQDGSEAKNLSELYDLNIVNDFRWYFLPILPE